MSCPMVRRVFAGLALVAVLATPAQAAGFGGMAGAPDLWSRAWSWLVGLWGGEVSGNVGGGATAVREQQTTGSSSDGDSTQSGDPTLPADRGIGIDPDG
jgi:hypothetical protein